MEIAKKYNLIVIEAGAHALGIEYKGKNWEIKLIWRSLAFIL